MTTQVSAVKKQQCNVMGLILSWVAYVAGFGLHDIRAPLGRWSALAGNRAEPEVGHVPGISQPLSVPWIWRVDDKLPANVNKLGSRSPSTVSSLSVLSDRVAAPGIVAKTNGFHARKIDVTLKPQVLISKGFPRYRLVEVLNGLLVGNATTEQLAGSSERAQLPEQ